MYEASEIDRTGRHISAVRFTYGRENYAAILWFLDGGLDGLDESVRTGGLMKGRTRVHVVYYSA
jgi:hypothetical protein